MPRLPRLVLPGFLHHITQRGNNRQIVFDDEQDRIVYLKYLNLYCKKYNTLIYAFCLMDNHVHFIVKPLNINSLARALNVTHQRYSFYYNKKNDKCGHLWQERFFSCPLHDEHIYKAIKYVEMNPVRGNITQYAWNYPWSSAKAHTGKKYNIIELSNIKEYIGECSWRDFLLKEESSEDIKIMRESTKYGKMAGRIDLIQKLEAKLKIKLLRKAQGRPKEE